MRAYLSTWRIRALCELQYRSAAFAGMITQLFFGFIIVMRYIALYDSGFNDPGTMPLSATVTYIWLGQALLRMTSVGGDGQIFPLILSGNIATDLCRPIDFYGYWMMRSLGARVVAMLMRAAMLLPIVVLLPAPYGFLPPSSALNLLLMLLSLSMGCIIACGLDGLVYAVTMRTLDHRGPSSIMLAVTWLCCGMIVPLPLMPPALRSILEMLPFAQLINLPINFYLGLVPPGDIPYALGVQLFWLLALIIIGKLVWARTTRRMALQGG